MDYAGEIQLALEQAFGPSAIIVCLAAVGLNIHFGYTGLLNFGQAGFMAVAGYGLASIVITWGFSFWLGVVVAILLCVLLALLLGVPTLRLRADYLAIVTIAAAEILRFVIGASSLRKWFGGQDGLQQYTKSFFNLNPYSGDVSILGLTWSKADFWVMTIGWALVAVFCVVTYLLMRSPWGRVLKAIREDEDAVRSLGKNVYAYKMQSLILGGVIGGFAGMVSGLYQSVQPTNFATDITFYAWTVLLLGGAARVLGPIAGAIIFWFLISFLVNFFDDATSGANPLIPNSIMDAQQASLMRFIFLGLSLMLLMIFRPQGIFGDRRELAIDAR